MKWNRGDGQDAPVIRVGFRISWQAEGYAVPGADLRRR